MTKNVFMDTLSVGTMSGTGTSVMICIVVLPYFPLSSIYLGVLVVGIFSVQCFLAGLI